MGLGCHDFLTGVERGGGGRGVKERDVSGIFTRRVKLILY